MLTLVKSKNGLQFHQYRQDEQFPLTHNSLNTKRGAWNMTLKIQVRAWEMHETMARVKPSNGIPTLPCR